MGIQTIQSLLDRYKAVKIVKATTLFDIEPSWEKLLEKQCPICGNKLLLMSKMPTLYCRGKRHPNKKVFLIGVKKLAQIMKKNDLIKSYPQESQKK